MPDCRCQICGNCQYDHLGFLHEFELKVECSHRWTFTTAMSGLVGKYERCTDCLEYWHMCDNCEGIEPETCLFNPSRSTLHGVSSETRAEISSTTPSVRTARSASPEPPPTSPTSTE